jgi:hypothetical protein
VCVCVAVLRYFGYDGGMDGGWMMDSVGDGNLKAYGWGKSVRAETIVGWLGGRKRGRMECRRA